MKITRRKMASALLIPAAGAMGQTPPATAEQELAAARARATTLSETLAKETVAMDTEPAVVFKA